MADTMNKAPNNFANKQATLHTASADHVLQVVVAASFLARLKGLMFSRSFEQGAGEEGADALLITHCPSVHTTFMRYPIDVVYLDNLGQVVDCVANLKPWRAHFAKPAKPAEIQRIHKPIHTLELATGRIAELNIQLGDQLRHPYFKPVNLTPVAGLPDTQQEALS
jgi:uncharacterized membrane protein (UPF0127 family)